MQGTIRGAHFTLHLKCRIRKHISDVPHAHTRNVSAASQHFASIHKGSITSFFSNGHREGFPSS